MGQKRRLTFDRIAQVVRSWSSRKKWVVFGIAGFLLLVSLAQLLYPGDRTLPFARLGGDRVGFMTHQAVAKKLSADYGAVQITTKIHSKETKTVLSKTGLTTDNEHILRELSDYPWYYRIVPFSILVKGALTTQSVAIRIDDARFSLYAAERSKECVVVPKNAGVVVKNGDVQIDPAKDGQACSKESLKRQFTAKPLEKNGITVTIQTTPVKPERSDEDVQPLLKEARTIATRKLTVVVAGKSYAIDKPTLASWLAFPEDPKTKTISVGVSDEAVKKYLGTIQKDVYVAPGTTVVTTRDSIETGRVTGRSGQGIDMGPTINSIRKQVLAGDGVATATIAVLPPNLTYNRSYSKTPAGLQALINDLVKDRGDFAISVRKLGDSGVHANGNKTYHPASTYKLFVAYSVLKRIDSGQMSWGQTASGGQTVSQCLDVMIINSDNACAEWFGEAISWGVISNEARAIGASSTTLSRPFVSTTNDMALFLQKLESNQLGLKEPSRARLLDIMKRQVFRQGIPAGVGVPVANKVGFIPEWGLLHDASIVYAPKGVYVLVIYSKGSSWAQIADAARQIHAHLN